jgi:predicted DNA-binding protein
MATRQITLKLPEETLARLDKLRSETNTSRNGIVLEMIEENLSSRKGRSVGERMEHLCGVVKNGAPDDSTSNAWRERLER